jgi:hypothetical protein
MIDSMSAVTSWSEPAWKEYHGPQYGGRCRRVTAVPAGPVETSVMALDHRDKMNVRAKETREHSQDEDKRVPPQDDEDPFRKGRVRLPAPVVSARVWQDISHTHDQIWLISAGSVRQTSYARNASDATARAQPRAQWQSADGPGHRAHRRRS